MACDSPMVEEGSFEEYLGASRMVVYKHYD